MNDEMAKAARRHLAKSIRSLARKTGKGLSTVRKWIARDDWPFRLMPPWDVRQVKAWAEIHLRPDPAKAYRDRIRAAAAGSGEFAELGPLTKVRIQAVIERTLMIRQRRLHEAAKVHDVEACQERRLRQIFAVKHALLALPRSIAMGLVGLGREAVEEKLLQRVNELLEEFAAGGSNPETSTSPAA